MVYLNLEFFSAILSPTTFVFDREPSDNDVAGPRDLSQENRQGPRNSRSASRSIKSCMRRWIETSSVMTWIRAGFYMCPGFARTLQ